MKPLVSTDIRYVGQEYNYFSQCDTSLPTLCCNCRLNTRVGANHDLYWLRGRDVGTFCSKCGYRRRAARDLNWNGIDAQG